MGPLAEVPAAAADTQHSPLLVVSFRAVFKSRTYRSTVSLTSIAPPERLDWSEIFPTRIHSVDYRNGHMHGRVGMFGRCYSKNQSVYIRPGTNANLYCFVHCSDCVAGYDSVRTAKCVLICPGRKHVGIRITPCSSHLFKNGTAIRTRLFGATTIAVKLPSQKLYTNAPFQPVETFELPKTDGCIVTMCGTTLTL